MVNLSVSNLFSLEGKTVVLTGASGYLGRTFSRAILENGGRLIALGRSDRLISETQRLAQEFGEDRITAHQIDMYDLDKLTKLLDEIATGEDRIDGLVNNAHELGFNTGFNTPSGSLENASFDQAFHQWSLLAITDRSETWSENESRRKGYYRQYFHHVCTGGP